MILKVIVDDQLLELNVPGDFIDQASDFFDKMDRDMDGGWQMSRDWIEAPDRLQRCQIAADKLLSALENEDHNLGRMMAGYILSRMPETESIEMDVSGEIQNHLFQFQGNGPVTGSTVPMPNSAPSSPQQQRALDQAGKEVSEVFKVGKQYRFTTLNSETGQWEESPAIGDKEQAEALREQALRQRAAELAKH